MIFTCPYCRTKVEKTATTCLVCHRVMTRHCSYCAEDISVLATICKYCGENVEPVAERAVPQPAVPQSVARPVPAEVLAPVPVAAPRRDTPEIEFIGDMKYCAWEDPAKKGIFGRWWSTWSESQFSPARFWQRVPTEGGHRQPNRYAWFLAAQALLFVLPFFALFGAAIGIAHDVPWWAYLVGAGAYAALFPLTYVTTVVGNTIAAALWHVVLKILGARGTFEGTLRIVAYNSGTAVWGIIPVLGGIIQGVMNCVLNYHGFRSVHGLSKGRAIFASLLPVLLGLVAIGALVAVAIACPHAAPSGLDC